MMQNIRSVPAVLCALLRQKAMRLAAGCFTIGLVMLLAAAVTCQAAWEGVDVNVVEKFAEKAGRPARAPLINTDQGDLLLFVFLLAGITGGFIGGYLFRGLFATPKPPGQESPYDG